MTDNLFPYFENELGYLRSRSNDFAESYPRLASRLSLSNDVSPDPHVERLIESFAFLSGRVQRQMELSDQYIARNLLQITYPHLTRVVPSRSIVQFNLDASAISDATSYKIPRQTEIYTRPVNSTVAKFSTCFDLELPAATINQISYVPAEEVRLPSQSKTRSFDYFLHIQLKSFNDLPIKDCLQNDLLLYVNLGAQLSDQLLELINKESSQLLVRHDNKLRSIEGLKIEEVGFDEDQNLLPYDARSNRALTTLHEYFCFPEKFRFFNITGLRDIPATDSHTLDLYLRVSEENASQINTKLNKQVNQRSLLMGCTPAINLFKFQTEPVRVNHLKTDYQVVPDIRRRWAYQIYSLEKVVHTSRTSTEGHTTNIAPLFRAQGSPNQGKDQIYWHSWQNFDVIDGKTEVDTRIALANPKLDNKAPIGDSLSIEAYCSNGEFPAELPFGDQNGDFFVDLEAPIATINSLGRPQPPLYPAQNANAVWRFVSHLASNHYSIVEGGSEALKGLLSVYNFVDADINPGRFHDIKNHIDGIEHVESESKLLPIGPLHRRSLCKGLLIKLHLDESKYAGSGVFVFSQVLDRFSLHIVHQIHLPSFKCHHVRERRP